MKYRSKIEIITKLLESAGKRGTNKIKLMYNVYLSYAQLIRYLELLQKDGLLTYDSNTKNYSTTEKGLKYLGYCHAIQKLMEEKINQIPA